MLEEAKVLVMQDSQGGIVEIHPYLSDLENLEPDIFFPSDGGQISVLVDKKTGLVYDYPPETKEVV
jgi:hypothetical protein